MGSFEIRDEDVELIKLLKKDKVVAPIDVNYFIVENGAVVVICSDCDQYADISSHFQEKLAEANKPNRIFLVSRAGGAIWIPNSDLLTQVGLPRDEDIFFDIGIAIEKKEISTIFTSIHAPCGAAGLYNLSLFDQVELLVQSKERLKARYSNVEGLEVKGFLHVCYPGVRRKTYFVSAANWYINREKYIQYDYSPDKLFSQAGA